MQKMRKILVPIDFTQESGRALRDAVALGRETGSVVVALHVIDEKAERDVLLSASHRSMVCRFSWTATQPCQSTSCGVSELSICGTLSRNTPGGCSKSALGK